MGKKEKKTYSTEQLIAVGKDMTISMILEPPVEIEGDDEEILGSIKNEATEIRPKDKFLPATIELLQDLGIELPAVKTWTAEQQQAELARQEKARKEGAKEAAQEEQADQEDVDKDPGGIVEQIKKEEAVAKEPPPKKKPTKGKTRPPTRAQIFSAVFTTKPVIKERLVKETVDKFGGSWRQSEIQIDIYLRLLIALGFATQTGDKYALKDLKSVKKGS